MIHLYHALPADDELKKQIYDFILIQVKSISHLKRGPNELIGLQWFNYTDPQTGRTPLRNVATHVSALEMLMLGYSLLGDIDL